MQRFGSGRKGIINMGKEQLKMTISTGCQDWLWNGRCGLGEHYAKTSNLVLVALVFAVTSPSFAHGQDATLTGRFDWAERGIMTPAKDQGDFGTCWAFASVGSPCVAQRVWAIPLVPFIA